MVIRILKTICDAFSVIIVIYFTKTSHTNKVC